MRVGYRRLDSKTMKERDDLIMRLVEQGVPYKKIGRQVRLGVPRITEVVRKRRKNRKEVTQW